MQKTKKRSFSGRLLSFAAAFATAAAALPALPALKAQAAGSITLSSDGTLTLSGAVTREQVWAYRSNWRVKRVVAADDCVLPADCAELFEGCVTETWDEYDDNGEFIMEDAENYCTGHLWFRSISQKQTLPVLQQWHLCLLPAMQHCKASI